MDALSRGCFTFSLPECPHAAASKALSTLLFLRDNKADEKEVCSACVVFSSSRIFQRLLPASYIFLKSLNTQPPPALWAEINAFLFNECLNCQLVSGVLHSGQRSSALNRFVIRWLVHLTNDGNKAPFFRTRHCLWSHFLCCTWHLIIPFSDG